MNKENDTVESFGKWSIEKLQSVLEELENKTPELRDNAEAANNAANTAYNTLDSHRRFVYLIKNTIRNKEKFER